MSAGFVLQLLIPLFVILLAFGAFAGERENGTLRQLLAAGARPSGLAAGKALGLTAALSLVLVPAAICAAVLYMVGFFIAELTDSCIFAWSSWLSRAWRSLSFFCRRLEFWVTAALA